MHYIQRILTPPKESFFLLGPRGTGKSTWLVHVYPNATRIDLLQPEQERIYLAAPERLREIVDAMSDGVIILDEIQRAPGLLPVIHSLIEEGKPIQFIMTGSSARKLRREVGNLLGVFNSRQKMYPYVRICAHEEYVLSLKSLRY